jgi:hypothetical protein
VKTVMLKLVHTETFLVPVVCEDDDVDIEERLNDAEYVDLDEIAGALRDGESIVGSPKFSPVDRQYDVYVKDGADYDPKVNFHIILKKDGDFDYGPPEEDD